MLMTLTYISLSSKTLEESNKIKTIGFLPQFNSRFRVSESFKNLWIFHIQKVYIEWNGFCLLELSFCFGSSKAFHVVVRPLYRGSTLNWLQTSVIRSLVQLHVHWISHHCCDHSPTTRPRGCPIKLRSRVFEGCSHGICADRQCAAESALVTKLFITSKYSGLFLASGCLCLDYSEILIITWCSTWTGHSSFDKIVQIHSFPIFYSHFHILLHHTR